MLAGVSFLGTLSLEGYMPPLETPLHYLAIAAVGVFYIAGILGFLGYGLILFRRVCRFFESRLAATNSIFSSPMDIQAKLATGSDYMDWLHFL